MKPKKYKHTNEVTRDDNSGVVVLCRADSRLIPNDGVYLVARWLDNSLQAHLASTSDAGVWSLGTPVCFWTEWLTRVGQERGVYRIRYSFKNAGDWFQH